MADVALVNSSGKASVTSTGKLLLGNSGETINCCCEPVYYKAKRCRDDAEVDLWIEQGDHTLPYYFKKSNVCYYIDGTVSNATPGTLLSGESSESDCTPCLYIQAKKCIDGTTADLWRLVSAGIPYYFHKAGVCYYIEDGNPTSATPGTLLSGETSMASCGVSPCNCARCSDAVPGKYTVTFAGVSTTGCSCGGADSTIEAITAGSLNGTWCLTRTTENGCTWSAPATGITVTHYNSGVTCASVAFTVTPTIELTRDFSNTWQLMVQTAFGVLFHDRVVTLTCSASASFTDDDTACHVGGVYGGLQVIAHSGTATITPGC